jgi:endonuclease/exonuclease/phosphatase family metal-dependent hydrolase
MTDERLRVMTYNIRRGRGTDGRVEIDRVADSIAAEAPDVMAPQEVDVLRTRSGGVDQAERLPRATRDRAAR